MEWFKHDPKLYLEMCQPHESADEAGKQIKAFFEEIGELRKRYRIADVHIIAQTNCLVPSGAMGIAGLSMHYGDSANGLTMTAREYARERQAHRAMLDRLLAMTDGNGDEDV